MGTLDIREKSEEFMNLLFDESNEPENREHLKNFNTLVVQNTARIVAQTVDFMGSGFGTALTDLFSLAGERTEEETMIFIDAMKDLSNVYFDNYFAQESKEYVDIESSPLEGLLPD